MGTNSEKKSLTKCVEYIPDDFSRIFTFAEASRQVKICKKMVGELRAGEWSVKITCD